MIEEGYGLPKKVVQDMYYCNICKQWSDIETKCPIHDKKEVTE